MENDTENIDIAFIGGSGLYELEDLEDLTSRDINTPFGRPSDSITVGRLGTTRVGFLPRHGRNHTFLPSEIPYKANIFALKSLGVKLVVSISAVGSLKEQIKPLEVVVPNQLIDMTKFRQSSYFGDGIVAHIPFADPFCPQLRHTILDSCKREDLVFHDKGTYIVIEGPQFSTKAESFLYKNWGADIIGMTALPEAKLAREAEICYGTIALVTDYDCWHAEEQPVSAKMVMSNLRKNLETSRSLIKRIVSAPPEYGKCRCGAALKEAFVTSQQELRKHSTDRIKLIVDKYI